MSIAISSSSQSILNEIDHKYKMQKNETNFFSAFSKCIQSNEGTLQFFKILGYSCRWGLFFSKNLNLKEISVDKLKETKSKFDFVYNCLIFPRFLTSVEAIKKSYSEKAEELKNYFAVKKILKITRNIFDALSDLGILIELGSAFSFYNLGVTGNSLKFAIKIFDLNVDALDLKLYFDDLKTISKENQALKEYLTKKEKINSRIKVILNETKILRYFKVALCIISFSISLFLIINVFFKTFFINSGIFLFFNSILTIFSMYTKIYEKTLTYEKNG